VRLDVEITQTSNAYPQWDEDYTTLVARVSESAPVNTVSHASARPGPARPGGVLFVGDVCVCLSVCLFVCLLLEALLENNTPAP